MGGSSEKETEDSRECRLCFEGGGDLIAPCSCSGTSKWVHRACLNRWRSMNHNPRAFTHCSECQFEYRLELTARTQPEMQRRIQLRVARDSSLVFAMVQSVICTAAVLVRCGDPNERMVKAVGLRQLPGQDESHGLLNALEHHKTTYYICGFLSTLAVVGVVAACVIIHDCLCGRSNGRSSSSSFVDYYFRPSPYRGQRRPSPRDHRSSPHRPSGGGGGGGGEIREYGRGGGGGTTTRCEGCGNCACVEPCPIGACPNGTSCACCEACEDCGAIGSSSSSGGGCGECAVATGEGAGGFVVVLFFILVCIGLIVAVIMTAVVFQRIVQRHYALIQRGALADEWRVVDLSAPEDGADLEMMESGHAGGERRSSKAAAANANVMKRTTSAAEMESERERDRERAATATAAASEGRIGELHEELQSIPPGLF